MTASFKTPVFMPFICLLAVLFTTPAISASAADDTVVAIVNGTKILKKDVLKAVEALPVKGKEAEAVYPMVVDQIINEKLIDEATAAAKIEESAEFKRRLNLLRDQMRKQMFVEKSIADHISDKRVAEEYAKFKKENKGKKEVRARHILLPTEVEAVQAIKDLDAGAKFADLAAKRSSGPTASRGGDLGYFTKEDMVKEFSAAAFSLKKGSYTQKPVKTQFGWHVILVEDMRERSVPTLKEVDMAIRNKLGQEAFTEMVDGLRAKATIERFDMDGKAVEKE